MAEQQLRIANRVKKGALLIYADLDHMKLINDQFGHQEGDLALSVGELLSQADKLMYEQKLRRQERR